MLKEKEVTKDEPTETIHDGSSAEAVNVEIARITKEKLSVSGAFDDAEDTKRVEV
jgi:shikimate kinase